MLEERPHPTTHTRITIDGRAYSTVDEMPPQVRERYQEAMRLLADRDGNGIPDALEGDALDPKIISHISTTKSEHFVVNGREYGSGEELPPDLRRLLDGAQTPQFQLHSRVPGLLLLLVVMGALAGGAIVWLLMR